MGTGRRQGRKGRKGRKRNGIRQEKACASVSLFSGRSSGPQQFSFVFTKPRNRLAIANFAIFCICYRNIPEKRTSSNLCIIIYLYFGSFRSGAYIVISKCAWPATGGSARPRPCTWPQSANTFVPVPKNFLSRYYNCAIVVQNVGLKVGSAQRCWSSPATPRATSA